MGETKYGGESDNSIEEVVMLELKGGKLSFSYILTSCHFPSRTKSTRKSVFFPGSVLFFSKAEVLLLWGCRGRMRRPVVSRPSSSDFYLLVRTVVGALGGGGGARPLVCPGGTGPGLLGDWLDALGGAPCWI